MLEQRHPCLMTISRWCWISANVKRTIRRWRWSSEARATKILKPTSLAWTKRWPFSWKSRTRSRGMLRLSNTRTTTITNLRSHLTIKQSQSQLFQQRTRPKHWATSPRRPLLATRCTPRSWSNSETRNWPRSSTPSRALAANCWSLSINAAPSGSTRSEDLRLCKPLTTTTRIMLASWTTRSPTWLRQQE